MRKAENRNVERDAYFHRGYWSTQLETDYLRYIGTYSMSTPMGRNAVEDMLDGTLTGATAREHLKRRERLLTGYLEAAENRADWGEINRDVAVSYAHAELVATWKLLGRSHA